MSLQWYFHFHPPVSQLSFKNYAPFTECITKVGGTTIDNAEDSNLVMSMYKLIEHSSSHSETKRSLWF